MITLGTKYTILLEKSNNPAILKHDIKKTDYGYKIKKISCYICITDTKLMINKNGSAKAVIKVNCNYQNPYQYTLYFDRDKREIKGKSTREETLYYKKIKG